MLFKLGLLLFGLLNVALAGLVDRGQDMVDAARYPQRIGPIRVELHISRLDTRGKSHTGLWCDITDKCDPRVIAFIDTYDFSHFVFFKKLNTNSTYYFLFFF